MTRALDLARRLLPALLFVGALLVAVDALAQSTGGSFGGGSFGGGGGGGGGGGYSGGDDGASDVVGFILYILFSRLPWPLKIGLVVLLAGGWGVFKLVRRRARRGDPQDPEDAP